MDTNISKQTKRRDDKTNDRDLSDPHCYVCSYGRDNIEHKFYAVAYADTGKLIETVEEFTQVVGHGFLGHRLCCDDDAPQDAYNITNHFGQIRTVRLITDKSVVQDNSHTSSARRDTKENVTQFVQQPPACVPLLSVNPLFNPYSELLTPPGSATRGLLAFPYKINRTVTCNADAPAPCQVQITDTYTTTSSLSYSVTDSKSNSFTNSVGSTSTVGSSTEAMQSISDTLEKSNSFTHTDSQGGSQSQTWSDALTKTSESQTNWQRTHGTDTQNSVNVGQDVNFQQSHANEDTTSSSDQTGWDTKASVSGTTSVEENFLVGKASESVTVSAEVGASGSHTDGRQSSVTDSTSQGISNSINTGRQMGSSDSSTFGGSRSDSISDAVTNSATSEQNWQASNSYASGNSQSHTVGSSNSYGTSKSLSSELQKTFSTAQTIDTTNGGSTDKGYSQSISITIPLAPGTNAEVAYMTSALFTQIPWICKQNGQNTIITTEMADVSKQTTSTALVLVKSNQDLAAFQFTDNYLTGATSTNSLASGLYIPVNQESTAGTDVTGGKKMIMSTTNYEVWLSGFGSMSVKRKDADGKVGVTLWSTHTNVQRTTDQLVNGIWYNKGTVRLLINDLGHMLIQADNMFNNIGVTPYNYTYYDTDKRQNVTDTFVTLWSNVPKHMMVQVGIKKTGYTLILEEFPATSGTTWNLVLYDGGGSKIWCATSAGCNWSGSTGYRFPRSYLLPTDFPTDAVDPQQDDASYPHNYLNPAYNLTVINPAIHISENQRCGPILTSGQGITSPNGRFKLILDWSGNLIFKDGVRTMWETLTSNVHFAQPPYQLQLSNRGSLYVTDKWGGLIVTSLVQTSIVRNSRLNITDQGELQIFGTDGRQIWTSFDLINPDLSGWKAWNTRKTFCYPGCKTCLPKQPPTITGLYSNGSDFTPFTGYLKAGQTLAPVSGNDSLTVTNTTVSIGSCDIYRNATNAGLIAGMILTISGTGRLSFIDANATNATWQIGTLNTGVEPFSVTVENSILTIRDSNGTVTSKTSCDVAIPNNEIFAGFDIPYFDLSYIAATTKAGCAAACDANSTCTWWNWQSDRGCYLKQTDKSDKNLWYTWFVNGTGAISGNIGAGVDLRTSFVASSPVACHAACQSTVGCHWVSYQYTSFNQQVRCFVKQASKSDVGFVTGYSLKPRGTTTIDMFTALANVDIQSANLTSFNNVQSVRDCSQRCQANTACDFFVFDLPAQLCLLKQTTKPVQPRSRFTWFPHANGPFFGDLGGYDLPGSAAFDTASPSSCIQSCMSTVGCHWINYMPYDDGRVKCWLKQGQQNGRFTGYLSSGGVVQRSDMDIPNYDVALVAANNATQCGQICAADSRCAWANFVPGAGCYEKAPSKKANMFMQFRESVEPFPGDVPGYDLANAYFVASSGAACYLKCYNNPQCDWVNYDATNAAFSSVPCWLKQGTASTGFDEALTRVYVLLSSQWDETDPEKVTSFGEGNGPATISAYVEVVFDNSDNRFPTGKDETVLRRTIGLKKDEYSLDKKTVTKTDVLNLLESAGFSRSNPYYIVPQGRIMALTNAKDGERLQLLKEVAGTRVYEHRRQESLKIMEETDSKRSKINELLDYIESRLTELEEEKEELKQYQELDKERRCLEYTIYHREQTEVNESLEKLEESRRLEVEGNNQMQNQYAMREKIITDLEREIRVTETKLNAVSRDRGELDDDKQELTKAIAALELVVKDLEEAKYQATTAKKTIRAELEKLDKTIATKEQGLAELLPQFVQSVEEERALQERKQIVETEKNALLEKQGRNKQFRTKAERDGYLRQEIGSLQTTVDSSKRQAEGLQTDIVNNRNRLDAVRKEIEHCDVKIEELKTVSEKASTDFDRLKIERNSLDEQKKELWREEQRACIAYDSANEERVKAERNLMSSMDRNTSSGIQAIQKMTERQNLRGVYGPLYQLFSVDERYQTAVEVVGGGSLFHVVVDTDETAQRLLDMLNRDRAGRVTFMPLNRLRPRDVDYPNANDAVPMVKKLQFDNIHQKAIMQVFGKAIICPSLEIAAQYARQDGLNAVTLDGDRADKKGSLTGGYVDHRRSRLETIRSLKMWDERMKQETETLSRVKASVTKVEQQITELRDKIHAAETAKSRADRERDDLQQKKRQKVREESDLNEMITQKEGSLSKISLSLKTFAGQQRALEGELASAFLKTLTTEELARLDAITPELEEISGKLTTASSKRAKLETRKQILTIELDANLRKRRDNLVKKLESSSGESDASQAADADSQLGVRKAELKALEKRSHDVEKRLKVLDTEIDDMSATLREQTATLEKTRTEQVEDNRSLEKQQRHLERYMQKKAILIEKKDECTKNIRDLGVLPEEALKEDSEWAMATAKQLLARLHKVNEGLKKYGHVNKKAFEQYNNFTKQRDSLNQRKDELDSSAQAIEELIKVLDQRKDEAIERTFKQVALFFAEVWKKLVPHGRGKLIMLSKAAKDVAEAASEEVDEMDIDVPASQRLKNSAIDRYSGVGISVSFHGGRHGKGAKRSRNPDGEDEDDESGDDAGQEEDDDQEQEDGEEEKAGMKRMNQLSGGQKSLVALALIFAIQKCDPAPFYLFDEIDAALDAQYRTAVANMVHELANDAQFITTTFRPELLVHADKFYGVTFTNKVSKIQRITRDDATQFVEQEQPH
ncbi:Structural maintenance of chromosomes protein 3 [Blyttiomyces sp. JEL0837]|nr:Structural maintenance of chromosomes protein 3 [Blyttiomyces sp. JEL0837]